MEKHTLYLMALIVVSAIGILVLGLPGTFTGAAAVGRPCPANFASVGSLCVAQQVIMEPDGSPLIKLWDAAITDVTEDGAMPCPAYAIIAAINTGKVAKSPTNDELTADPFVKVMEPVGFTYAEFTFTYSAGPVRECIIPPPGRYVPQTKQ